jgi:hypothetical protein
MYKLSLAASICTILIAQPATYGMDSYSETTSISGITAANLKRQDAEQEANSLLKGISELSVQISMPPFSHQEYINHPRIAALVEKRLRSNGIVVGTGLGLHKKHSAMLHIAMSHLAGPKDGSSAFVLRTEVLAEVRPIQNPKNFFLTPLYAYERLEHVGTWNLKQEDLEADILDCVDHVIDKWKPSKDK